MPAFGCNSITLRFAIVVRDRERLLSGDGSEENPFVYEKIGFRLSDRIVSALDRFIGALSRFRLPNTALMDRWLFIYPFIGGVDWVHAMNLSDVAGNFTKYTLSYTGNITHNQNGVTFTTGSSANTNCDCADVKTNPEAWNRKTFGLYSRTNSAVNTVDMYAGFVEPRNGYSYSQGLYPRYGDGRFIGDLCYYGKAGVATTPNRAEVAVSDSLGLFTNNQRGLTYTTLPHYLYKRGVHVASDTTGEAGMGYGDGIVHAYMVLQGTRNIAFAFSTKHTKTLEYYTAAGQQLAGSNAEFYYFVQQFQVALLRNV